MADITMCLVNYCLFADRCYRKTAVASETRQSYAVFDAATNDGESCIGFWDNRLQEDRMIKKGATKPKPGKPGC